jgi:glycosyltransferase involved in cell wall biosynthesis
MSSKKIVIAFIIDFLSVKGGISGGTEKQLVELINKLDKEKFKPLLYCLQSYDNPHKYDSVNVGKNVLNVYTLKSIKNSVTILKFANELRNNSVDIVHAFFFDSILFGVISAKLAGIKTIISSRRDLGFWYSKSLLRWLKFINLFTDRFLVNSISVKQELVKMEGVNPELIDVIHNGIDLKRIENTTAIDIKKEFGLKCNDNSFNIVGIVGNLNRKVKKVDLFIRAATEVLEKFENVIFLIIGAGRYQNELETLSSNLGIGDHVVFAGYKSDAISYMKNFTIGVNTSDSEGFSNTILEYMAAGIPVVATNVSGNAELVQDGITGILVPQGNHGEIAHAICELLSDENKRHRMGIESKKNVEEKYSWDFKIKEIENYYLNIANRK